MLQQLVSQSPEPSAGLATTSGRNVLESSYEILRPAFSMNAQTFRHGVPAQMFSTSPSRQADSSVKDAELGPQDEDAKEAGSTSAPGPAGNGQGTPENGEEMAQHEADLKAMSEEVDDLKDKLARSLADMENLRDRTARASEQSRNFAIQKFVTGLLGVADDMERALESVPADAAQQKDPAALLKGLRDGIALTHKTLEKVLSANGVSKVTAEVGQQMDPNLHEAMFDVPNPAAEPGSIAIIVKPGYTLNGRVIRPVEVGTVRAVKG
ncbi:g3786 [Coccomyxa viridis]|uniref:G3786 protein n=1 Tax=Coccomyxa viridis TaxID=1274662 RepID=A0ABP1FNM0_9CHLO